MNGDVWYSVEFDCECGESWQQFMKNKIEASDCMDCKRLVNHTCSEKVREESRVLGIRD